MKIVTVVGARPQFIKAAAGSREIRKEHQEILIHTGQHFDDNMSAVFFREMGIPKPDYNLGISGGTHAQMTAKMLVGIEEILIKEEPDALLVYGDTNSTLAATLAAVKLNIPVIHVEAGNRLGTLDSPEEVNRITTDHLATLDFCATEDALDKLRREGLGDRSFCVGNIMYDSFLHFANQPWVNSNILDFNDNKVNVPKEYYYMTCHRQENTYSDEPLTEILLAMNSLDAPTIYAVHPRNHERAKRIVENNNFNNIILTQPVGYSDSIHLTKNAKKIVTDSGGLQCEAFYAGVQCVFVLDFVVWPETMVDNRNQLAKADHIDILKKLRKQQTINPGYQPFGNGHAAEEICRIIKEWERKRH
ncbi:non-hydrolyzing UDP-N-acetylglucosamine 2-epimerase [Faecalibaculum rodentium]|jgi:UDP-N-acetylglucosamine 2-epimerase (non-hydrolysing)/UDP-GlcNAc3NAcA epimerase|uniref:non-hydrolyzing UDP-N-acetylglucosamine 2-epimerase n=1 Tax=Faecalibaculum rodentium TaxID=1702221 RepID=UPI00256FAF0B|nr:UDP-N-acetylglucosamine 2-epimerase (non-hydrolyzing) [Faecalibaculum rodentium]